VRIECHGQEIQFWHKRVLQATVEPNAGVLTSGRVGIQARTVAATPMPDNFAAGTLIVA